MSADAKPQETQEQKPQNAAAPSAAPTPAPAAAPSVDIAALEKKAAKADKLEKELAAVTEKMKSPEFVKESIASLLGLQKDEDPKAKFSAAEARANSLATENARIKAERAVEKVALKFDAEDAEEHFDAAKRAGLIGDDYAVDPAALAKWMEDRKASRPRLFKAAPVAAAPASGPPPAPGTKPPTPTQPAATPPPPAGVPGAFASFLHPHVKTPRQDRPLRS